MSTVGFDFGTTNSLVSAIRGEHPINYLDDEGRPVPSIVCYEGKHTIVGRAARERLAQAGLGIQGNLVRSPKLLLGRDSVFVEGVERSPVDIVADVVRHVLRLARESRRGRDLGSISSAVVTIPIDMTGNRRRALRDAFRLANLSIAQFVHEPLAALYGYFRTPDLAGMLRRFNRKLILVFDWGGGTLDLTLCRLDDGFVVQLFNDGTEDVGGDVFDEAIMNRLLREFVASAFGDTEPDIHHGARSRLMDRCERAKIDLSDRASTQVYVRSYFRGSRDEDFDCSLTQEQLEQIVTPLLDSGFRRIDHILERAGYAPEQVALCLATGGMSNMPAVQRRLHERFGPDRVRVPDGTQTLIAEGAAWIASDKAGLKLAKDVELLLARDSYLTLIRAGTAMPREGEVRHETFHLYCADPRDGIAKFQLCAPNRPGHGVLRLDPRTPLETLSVRVDRNARPFSERLELDIKIDDDLVLDAHARSLGVQDQDRREIHDLEFGLGFPGQGQASPRTEPLPSEQLPSEPISPGGLSVRANTTDRTHPRLVPGELLYSYDPNYFDSRRSPPEYQVRERLYYEPCAVCNRASSDPLCTC